MLELLKVKLSLDYGSNNSTCSFPLLLESFEGILRYFGF